MVPIEPEDVDEWPFGSVEQAAGLMRVPPFELFDAGPVGCAKPIPLPRASDSDKDRIDLLLQAVDVIVNTSAVASLRVGMKKARGCRAGKQATSA